MAKPLVTNAPIAQLSCRGVEYYPMTSVHLLDLAYGRYVGVKKIIQAFKVTRRMRIEMASRIKLGVSLGVKSKKQTNKIVVS